ncbi:DUF4183 domain-containing protein [Virgibacillus chiguensis]|uniref:DUF4183 domain-containing protein n=1 Tax=Virgibacillus chiguensis TaxID=411959 RepID=A0A1M5Q8Z5_9BACI|nr:DUF4183 domain-containing protein [Virgibacillus chiguensis]SHH10410.1 protein of unknown function [Virgibacillus chiguensis]
MAIVKQFMGAERFVATIGDGTGTGATFNILATDFTDDTGAAATAFPTAPAYYNLYLNGVLQTADTSSLTTTEITIPDGDTLNSGVPVIVECVVN